MKGRDIARIGMPAAWWDARTLTGSELVLDAGEGPLDCFRLTDALNRRCSVSG